MSCDLNALSNLDTGDPDQLAALADQCTSIVFSPTLWIWAIGLTVIGAIGGAWIGKRKNTVTRDAVLGAALGPIGWIISIFLPAPKPPRTCPACKRVVGPTDAHCKFCGTKLSTK